MIRIFKKKNPGIFVKDNSMFEFQKYKEYIEENLLKNSITISNISYNLLINLINNIDLANIVIEKYSNSYGVYLKVDFPDETYGRLKNFTYSLLIFDSITLFLKTYIYVPLVHNYYYDSILNETNIYKIIKEIYPLFIENFIKLCKQNKISVNEQKEIKKELQNKFERFLRTK